LSSIPKFSSIFHPFEGFSVIFHFYVLSEGLFEQKEEKNGAW